jgi:hypothetical protein
MLQSGAAAVLSLPGDFPLKIYGPALELRVRPGDFGSGEGKIITLLPPLLGCAVLADGEGEAEEIPGRFTFRAAAAVNMQYRRLPAGAADYSFAWNIGKLRWLPSCCRGEQ